MTEARPEGVWIRWCEPCRWLSPTYYRYTDVVASQAEHNKGNGRCFPRTVGRYEYGTPAAVVADRLPEWARETYWGRTADRYFASALDGPSLASCKHADNEGAEA